jgi:hypothetical protein
MNALKLNTRSNASAKSIAANLRIIAAEFRRRNIKGGVPFSDAFLWDAPRRLAFEASRLMAKRAIGGAK